MQADFLSFDLYAIHLRNINGISFTRREIEIIAFLISGRGVKVIASFLSISPKTVETHVYNIMLKLESNSREGIIKFIEKSDKVHILRKHYLALQLQFYFDEELKKLAKINSEKKATVCFLIENPDDNSSQGLRRQLEKQLSYAGAAINIRSRKITLSFMKKMMHLKEDYIVCIVPEAKRNELERDNTLQHMKMSQISAYKKESNTILIILSDNKRKIVKFIEFSKIPYLCSEEQTKYYSSFVNMLEFLFPEFNLEKIRDLLQRYSDGISMDLPLPKQDSADQFQESVTKDNILRHFESWSILKKRKKKLFLPYFLLVFIIYGVAHVVFNSISYNSIISQNKEELYVRSNLIIPTESALLIRSKLLAEMDKKLNDQEEIQNLALIGIGGSGKTTLARAYARFQNAPVVWEINAETHETLKNSFESLAGSLAKSEEDNKIIRNFKDIRDSQQRKEKILAFIKEKLRLQSQWLLIFDNVERFSDIQDYFPANSAGWGKGRVLLTTQDAHIQQNNQINACLVIEALNPQEKNALFTKIMNNGENKPLTKEQKKFLEEIPSYPLDVSIAANYLKTTQIPYNEYLKNLKKSDPIFITTQENLLKETSNYTKTRYHIVVTSLRHLLDSNKDFPDLLLLVSLIDSQNIPKDLLNTNKNNLIVDNFICNLKKNSLIISQSSPSVLNSMFSIHRSTQEISFHYLFKRLNLDKNHQPLLASGQTLESYMSQANEDEDYEKMKLLITHGEKYLSHGSLIPQKIRSIIEGQLGRLYFNLSQDIKAKELLEKSLSNLKKHDDQNHDKIFWTSWILGDVYKVLGEHEKSKSLLELTWNNFKTYYPSDHINIAHICFILGDMYRTIGNYGNAKDFFEKSMFIYKKHFPEDHKMIGRLMAFLGNVYVLAGNYKEGKSYLENSLIVHKKHFSEDHVNVARVLKFQGILENKLGNYEKAKALLEKSISIYKNKYSEESLKAAWVTIVLGNVYINLDKALEVIPILEQALKIHRRFLPENKIGVGMSLAVLGDAYLTTGNYQRALSLLKESLRIHCDQYGSDHVETARVLLSMGYISLQEGNLKAAENQFCDVQNIFQKNKHPDIYLVYEAFSDLYNQKSALLVKEGDIRLSQYFKDQAIYYLNKSIKIILDCFPKNNFNIMRLQFKIKSLHRDVDHSKLEGDHLNTQQF